MDQSIIKRISVNIKSKQYDIIIGSSILSMVFDESNILIKDKIALIISSNIYNLYKNSLLNLFYKYNNYDVFLMEDGENYKSYCYAEEFLNKLLEMGYTRKSLIIGIGGGVVGDFSGFISSVYMRGINLIHIPTTLLAMVDSSIGGKVAVNISKGKNIIGSFHHPEMVITDVSFIKTLPDRELKNGLTEIVKHSIIGENELLDLLLKNNFESLRDNEVLLKILFLSAKFKSSIVEKDEKEEGIRAILNFGHTVGHAIESNFEYMGISHGEAVSIGLRIEMEISRRLGWITNDEMSLFDEIFKRYHLPCNDYNISVKDVVDHLKYDKKNSNGRINFVLLKGIGKPVYNQQVDDNLLNDVLKSI